MKAETGWGYSGIEPTKEAMLERLNGLVKALRKQLAIWGPCLTPPPRL